MKKSKILTGFLISSAAVIWLCFSIKWRVVGNILADLELYYLILPLPVLLLHFWLRAIRWQYLLSQGAGVPLSSRFNGILIGALATFILPLRAGEFARALYLKIKREAGFLSAFFSIIIERIFDLSAVLLTFGIIAGQIKGIPQIALTGAYTLTAIGAVLALITILIALFPDSVRKFYWGIKEKTANKLYKSLHKIDAQVEGIIEAASVIKNSKNLLIVCALTVLVWLSSYFVFYLFLLPFSIKPSFMLALTASVFTALAVAPPSAPGFIGTYQIGCIVGFKLLGYTEEIATAYAIISHLYQYIFFLVIGFWILFKEGLSLSSFSQKQNR